MNVRVVVTVTASALALGTAALPAQAASVRGEGARAVPAHAAASCNFSRRGLTIEQAVAQLGRDTQQRFKTHPLYGSFKHKKLSSLPAGVRKDFEEACKKGR
ncbi:hypothetical protein [Actinomadura harenae]|uniref:Uncharacterized protein n=1 Tax=Actinomadura harenae TaxID=2483351 RepID=A0A3M2MBC0_9ACTN|nr:hypothetical protein [Actinomadura harenae]RMI44478.1 hypothetical protein EBO15_12585 [Actinomadura harenae]